METKNELIPKEIVAATAAEPAEQSIACLKRNTDYSITSISLQQKCLLCDNTRELPAYMASHTSPYICEECQEAIAYVKEIMKHRGTEIFYD